MSETTNELPFFESIRLYNGNFELLELHEQRIHETQKRHFGWSSGLKLSTYLRSFDLPPEGLFKCRLHYGLEPDVPVFIPYSIKPIRSLKLVEVEKFEYASKYTDRSSLEELYEQRGPCDDVLIVQNNKITDTSYCNIVFGNKKGWFTPTTALLKGVRRQYLLNKGTIKPLLISLPQLKNFTHFRLINAMIPWEDAVLVPVHHIKQS